MRKIVQSVLTTLLVCALVFHSLSCYALDERYFSTEIWNEEGESVVTEEDWGYAAASFVTDESEGILYIYAVYYDLTVNTADLNGITITFYIKNSTADRKISCTDTADSANSFASVTGNFDEAYSGAHGGKIFAALELKDKAAKAQKNTISCELFYGSRSVTLFESAELDMTAPALQKQTAKDKTSKTVKSEKTSVSKAVQVKSSPKKTTAFTGNGSFSEEGTELYAVQPSAQEGFTEVSPKEFKTTLSGSAKVTAGVAAGMIIAGALLLALGLAAKADKAVPDEIESVSETESNETPNNKE